MRWWVLRAAFHCGPKCAKLGWAACGKASINVQQGATSTLAIFTIMVLAICDDSSSACACGEGTAITTASKPE